MPSVCATFGASAEVQFDTVLFNTHFFLTRNQCRYFTLNKLKDPLCSFTLLSFDRTHFINLRLLLVLYLAVFENFLILQFENMMRWPRILKRLTDFVLIQLLSQRMKSSTNSILQEKSDVNQLKFALLSHLTNTSGIILLKK